MGPARPPYSHLDGVSGKTRPREGYLLRKAREGESKRPVASPPSASALKSHQRIRLATSSFWSRFVQEGRQQQQQQQAAVSIPPPSPTPPTPTSLAVLGALRWDDDGERLSLLLGPCPPHRDRTVLTFNDCAISLLPPAGEPLLQPLCLVSSEQLRQIRPREDLMVAQSPVLALQAMLRYAFHKDIFHSRFSRGEEGQKVLWKILRSGVGAQTALALALLHRSCQSTDTIRAMEALMLLLVSPGSCTIEKMTPLVGPSALHVLELRVPDNLSGALFSSQHWQEGPLAELCQTGLVQGGPGVPLTIPMEVWRTLVRVSFLYTGTWSDAPVCEIVAQEQLRLASEVRRCLTSLARYLLGFSCGPMGNASQRYDALDSLGLAARCFESDRQVEALLEARKLRVECSHKLWPVEGNQSRGEPRWFLNKAKEVVAWSQHGLSWRKGGMLQSDYRRLQPSREQNVVIMHYSATRQLVIALLMCIRGIVVTVASSEQRMCALHFTGLLLSDEYLRPFTRNLRRELWTTRLKLHAKLCKEDKLERMRLFNTALESKEAEELMGGDRCRLEKQRTELAKSMGDTTPPRPYVEPPPPEKTVLLTELEAAFKDEPLKGQARTRRIYKGGLTVEGVALQHFQRLGYDGAYSERRLFLFFYRLLFLEQIRDANFSSEAYASPFHTLPLDVHFSTDFYKRRARPISDRMKELERLCEPCGDEESCSLCYHGIQPCAKTRLFDEVARAWDAHRRALSRYRCQQCRWLTKRKACEIASALGKTLIFIISVLMQDLTAFQKGLPDLLLWGPADQVKTRPSDDDSSGGESSTWHLDEEGGMLRGRQWTWWRLGLLLPFWGVEGGMYGTPTVPLEEEEEEEDRDEEAGEEDDEAAAAALTGAGGAVSGRVPRGVGRQSWGWGARQICEEGEEEEEDDDDDDQDGGGKEGEPEATWMARLKTTRLVARLVEVKSVHDTFSADQLSWHALLARRGTCYEEVRVLHDCKCDKLFCVGKAAFRK